MRALRKWSDKRQGKFVERGNRVVKWKEVKASAKYKPQAAIQSRGEVGQIRKARVM
jgi:hypothetical protein